MRDEVLKQLKHDLLSHIKPDVKMLLQENPVTGIKAECGGSNADSSCIEIYFKISLDYGKTGKPLTIIIDNYVLIPNMVQHLDAKANIPEKNYYPPAVGEMRKDISDLTRARLRIMWITGKSLAHYRAVFIDRWGPTISDGKEFKARKKAVVEVNTSGELLFSYDD